MEDTDHHTFHYIQGLCVGFLFLSVILMGVSVIPFLQRYYESYQYVKLNKEELIHIQSSCNTEVKRKYMKKYSDMCEKHYVQYDTEWEYAYLKSQDLIPHGSLVTICFLSMAVCVVMLVSLQFFVGSPGTHTFSNA